MANLLTRAQRLPLLFQRATRRRQPERRPRPPSYAIGADADAHSLWIALAELRGRTARITQILSAPLAPDSDAAALGRALAQTLESARLRNSAFVLGLPRAHVLLRTLLVPVVDDLPELASLVQMQLAKDLPFRIEDAVVDFTVLRRLSPADSKPAGPTDPPAVAPAPKLEILAAVVKRELLDHYRAVAAGAGLKLSGLGLIPLATGRCLHACGFDDPATATALVSLRKDEVNLDILAGGSVSLSRSAVIRPGAAPADLPSDDPPASFAELAAIEVVRSIRSYSGLGHGTPLKQVFVTGCTGLEDDVVVALQRQTGLPVERLQTSTLLKLPQDAAAHAAGATAAIGLALGALDPDGLPCDFLNPKRPGVPRDLRTLRFLALAAAIGIAALSVAGFRTWSMGQRQKLLASIIREADAEEKKRPIYRQMLQQAAVANEWVAAQKDWLDHYGYLSAVLPPSEEVHITSFTIAPPRTLRLAVQARSGEILAKVEKQLRAAGYDVKPLSITPATDRNGYDFRSSVELLVPEKLKIDLSKVKTPDRPADDASLDPPTGRKGGG